MSSGHSQAPARGMTWNGQRRTYREGALVEACSAKLIYDFEREWRERRMGYGFSSWDGEEPHTSINPEPNSQACIHSGARGSDFKIIYLF